MELTEKTLQPHAQAILIAGSANIMIATTINDLASLPFLVKNLM